MTHLIWHSLPIWFCITAYASDDVCGSWLLDRAGSDAWAYDASGSPRISAAINALQFARLRIGRKPYPNVSRLLRETRLDRRDGNRRGFSVNFVDTLRLLAQSMAPEFESDVTLWRLQPVEPNFRRPEIIEVDSFRAEHWQLKATGSKLLFGEFTHPDRTPNSFGLFLVVQSTPDELTVIDALSKDSVRGRLTKRVPFHRRGMSLTSFDCSLDGFPEVMHFTPYTITSVELRPPVVVNDQWDMDGTKSITLQNLEIEFGEGRLRTVISSQPGNAFQIQIGNQPKTVARLLATGDDGKLLRLVFSVPMRSIVLAEPSKRDVVEHRFVEHYSVTLLKEDLSVGSVRRFYIDPVTKEEYAWPGAPSYNQLYYPVRRAKFWRGR